MNKVRYYSPILLIVSISFLVYLNSLRNGFVWDDMVLIVDNEGIAKWGRFWESFVRDFFDTADDTIEFKYGYYRPVISLSYMIDYTLWGLKPWGFHFSNIIFHTVSCILVYLIGNSLFNNRSVSLVASLLFTCHPIHTESVTWVSGRTDVIAGMFFLSAFYLYQRAIYCSLKKEEKWGGDDYSGAVPAPRLSFPCKEREDGDCLGILKQFFKQGTTFYVCSIMAFALAMLCKEMVATLPFLLIAYTFYFARWRDITNFKISFFLSIPYLLVLLIYSITRFFILKISTVANPGGEEMTRFYPTAISFIKTIFLYLFKLVYPIPLSAYIQNPMSFSVTEPVVVFSLIGFVSLIFFIVWLRKRWARMSFMILFYLVTLLPLSNFVRISAPWDMGFVMAERFLYIPSFGFCGIVAVSLARVLRTKRYSLPVLKYAAISLTIILLICYSGRTFLRNRDWVDEKTFFLKTVKDTPDAALIQHALGNVYAREENYEEALEYYKKSLELYPLYHAAYNNIGTIYSNHGLLDYAIIAFKNAITINPDYVQAHFNLGTMYYQKGMIKEASDEFKRVLTLSKNYVKAHNNLGIIYAENGQLNDAITEFEKIITHDPHNEKAKNNLAIIKERLASESTPDKNLP